MTNWKQSPISDKQFNLISKLQSEKICQAFTPEELRRLNQGVASELIGQLFAAARKPVVAGATQPSLDFAGMVTLFRRAAEHLKFPKVRLSTPAGVTLVLGVAGSRARFPGSINVMGEKDAYGERPFYGRVHLNGQVELRTEAPAGTRELLARFSATPAEVAAEYGHLHGHCCFCNLPLSDERSTAVGYGATCAGHYGLAWGAERTDLRVLATAGTPQVATLAGMTPLGLRSVNTRGHNAGRPATDCGQHWTDISGCCILGRADGAHYHYGDGSCDTEPCYRHGGPA